MQDEGNILRHFNWWFNLMVEHTMGRQVGMCKELLPTILCSVFFFSDAISSLMVSIAQLRTLFTMDRIQSLDSSRASLS